MAASLLYASDELHEKLADAESKSKADTAKLATEHQRLKDRCHAIPTEGASGQDGA